MRQVPFLPLVCVVSFATSLYAEEARRAELVRPPKKPAAEEPARALPVTATDKKEVALAAKKDGPSIEIDLGAKKEVAQSAKKEVSSTEKKATSSVAKNELSQPDKKEVHADKKEVSAIGKKEVAAVAKKETSPSATKEINLPPKKEVAQKEADARDKKEVGAVAKKEVSRGEKKEVSVDKTSSTARNEVVAAAPRKEVTPSPIKEVASVGKKEISSKAKEEFTFKDPKGKTVSAEVVDQYQSKRIVYPLAKIDQRVNVKLVHAASIAQDRARAHSKSACWHYVKNALLASGVISTYPKSVYAKQAGDELVRDYGFRKLPIHDPYKAPVGAVLVYGSRRAAGHVELRTKTGFVSDFQNKKPSRRPLLGIYAKA